MAYTGHSEVADHEPPTFAVVGERDGIASPAVMERRVAALRRTGTEVEFLRYNINGLDYAKLKQVILRLLELEEAQEEEEQLPHPRLQLHLQ